MLFYDNYFCFKWQAILPHIIFKDNVFCHVATSYIVWEKFFRQLNTNAVVDKQTNKMSLTLKKTLKYLIQKN